MEGTAYNLQAAAIEPLTSYSPVYVRMRRMPLSDANATRLGCRSVSAVKTEHSFLMRFLLFVAIESCEVRVFSSEEGS